MESSSYSTDDISGLPSLPGVYKHINAHGQIIYVGKAKNIKKRVSSYFSGKYSDRKTSKMVKEIASIEVVIVNSEFDALLLENNLIKEFQPKYNILLKDDKTFPYLVITNERFPRVFPTRRKIVGRGQYFGPYASVKAMLNILTFIRSLYHIRTCKYVLSEENIEQKKFKVCLEYHIGNCLGPCENLQKEEDYMSDIEQVKQVLKGKLSVIKKSFKAEMEHAARNLAFEKAAIYKEKLELIHKFQIKSFVVNEKISDLDVCTISSDDRFYYTNYMKVDAGSIVTSETRVVKKVLGDDQTEDILLTFYMQFREKFHSENNELLTNVELSEENEHFIIYQPKIGDKRKLVELSLKNAFLAKKEKQIRREKEEGREDRILTTLKEDLNLDELPRHIECFDNSNIQGHFPVAAMVCFKNAKPSKKDYRKFNIKSVVGPDDFKSMNEIVYRRYLRLLEEKLPLPDLIVIDGGKGQLNAAVEALKALHLFNEIAVVGIAKRLEEIYKPGDSYPLYISKKSESLKLLQYLRDEAHRFAITFHRDKRSKTITSQLASIPGIGDKTVELLLRRYGSMNKIKQAEYDDIKNLIGTKKTKVLLEYIKKEGG